MFSATEAGSEGKDLAGVLVVWGQVNSAVWWLSESVPWAQWGLLGTVGTAESPWCSQGTLQLCNDANSWSGSTGVIFLPHIIACLYNPVDGCWLKMEEEEIVP